MYRKKLGMTLSVLVLCVSVIACSSSDAGRLARLQEQLQMAEAGRIAAEQERDAARDAQSAAEAAQVRAGRTQSSAEAARLTAELERDAAKAAQATAAQTLAGREYDAAVASAVERVTVRGLRHEINRQDGRPRGTSGWLSDSRAFPDSGSEFVAVSQTHADGDQINMAVPWRDDNGDLQFWMHSSPARGLLSRDDGSVYVWSDIRRGEAADRGGVATSQEPVQRHGLGEDWQGFDLMKVYGGHGTRRVRLFSDVEESDVLAHPYDGILSGYDDPEHQVFLSDERVPGGPSGPAGRDGLYIRIPEDGLQGSLDGVAGTFSCAGDHCTLLNNADFSGYTPWTDSAVVRFTPADGGADVMLDSVRVVRPSTEVPKVNYLVFGNWQDIPEDVQDVDGYDFGVFAGGDDPFMARNLPALVGTAAYAGRAAGTYVETVRPQTESFAADVDLMADFGSEDELGRVTGEVSDFRLASGKSMPVSSLRLQPIWDRDNEIWAPNIRASWEHDDNLIPGGLIEGETIADGGWWGLWTGRFFGNGAGGATHPASFAGTFGATDGTRSIAGSFGAHAQ